MQTPQHSASRQRMYSVARKEFLHVIRDPGTLFFAMFIPIIQMTMLGYAIDTNVRNVRTVVVDHAGTQESRQLLQQFETTNDFLIVAQALSDVEARQMRMLGEIDDPDEVARRNVAAMRIERCLGPGEQSGIDPGRGHGLEDRLRRGQRRQRLHVKDGGNRARRGRRGHQQSPGASGTQAQDFPTIQRHTGPPIEQCLYRTKP